MGKKDEYQFDYLDDDRRFAPVITLVVHFGADGPWDGARCLYDLLDIDEELKAYVTKERRDTICVKRLRI